MIIILYFLLLLGLGVYSYSQIDLNLTLLQMPWFLGFQQIMIQLGYFNRPLSTAIFLIITLLLFVFYILFLKNPPKKYIFLIGGIVLLGLFSYPAFSHDLFNSMFYPRIIFEHNANPYQVTALMYPEDLWTRFMHWTHNTYQWGPVYLILTVPFYLLGLGKFVLTLFWFKLMSVLIYLGCSYFVYRLAKTRGLVLFAFNPLIIIEGIITGHLDLVMLFFALMAIYFLSKEENIKSYIFLLLSIGIKFATVLFLPVFVFWKRISEKQRMIALISLAYFGAMIQLYFRDLLPHYFIVPLGVAALYPKNRFNVGLLLLLSFVLLLIRYLPFLYSGQWPNIKF
ncbi:hypothetical protein HY085_02005 [Candidatus Gottesmanbacteria bacterium]|nr:hypothetical protein [Candidatus Gottesmanbacteria bacterium]